MRVRVLAASSLVFASLMLVALELPAAEDSAENLLREAGRLADQGKHAEALGQVSKALEAEPNNPAACRLRARLYVAQGKHEQAVEDYSRAIKQRPDDAELYDERGSAQFQLGKIDESIADFDRFVELRPELEPHHWKRGISYYYAGLYDQGRKQFEGYQTVDDNDVENAVWRYLCMARADSPAAARAALLKIRDDKRVPMMTVYALFAGQATADDVLAAARAGNPTPAALNNRLFYAHLYLGLYYETEGDPQRALQHISTAADKHKIGHYMWDVARVHAERLRNRQPKP